MQNAFLINHQAKYNITFGVKCVIKLHISQKEVSNLLFIAINETLLLAAFLRLLCLVRLLLPVYDAPDRKGNDDDAAWNDGRTNDGCGVVFDTRPRWTDGPVATAIDRCPNVGQHRPCAIWEPFFVMIAEVPNWNSSRIVMHRAYKKYELEILCHS